VNRSSSADRLFMFASAGSANSSRIRRQTEEARWAPHRPDPSRFCSARQL